MSTSVDKKKILAWAVALLATLIVALIPTGELYTPIIRNFCAITVFCIAALAFDLLDIYIVGLGMPLAYVLLGVADFSTAFSGWANSTTLLLITAMLFANTLDRIGLLKRMGLSLILKLGGSFSKTMWALLFTGILITFITFCNCPIIVIALGYAVYRSFDLKPTDREAVVVLMVVALSACTAQMFSYNALLVSVLSSVTSVIPDFSLPWYKICLNNLPSILFLAGFTWILLKWAKRGKNSRITDVETAKSYCEQEHAALGAVSPAEKKGAAVLLLVMLYMFTQPLHKLDIAYGFFLGTILLFLPGIRVANASDLARVPWNLMFLVFAFLGIGAVAGAIGFTNVISQFLTPLISKVGMTGSVYVTYFFGVVANLILSPFAMCSMLTIPIAQYCTDLGFNVLPHILALYQACDTVFLPYEWPAYLQIFSFGFVSMSTMIKAMSVKAVFQILFICLLLIPFWGLIGLIC